MAAKNVTFKVQDVRKLAKDKFSLMTIEDWVSVCRCVKEGEKIYIRNEHVMDGILRSSDLDLDTD
jgi:hypothetical protein